MLNNANAGKLSNASRNFSQAGVATGEIDLVETSGFAVASITPCPLPDHRQAMRDERERPATHWTTGTRFKNCGNFDKFLRTNVLTPPIPLSRMAA